MDDPVRVNTRENHINTLIAKAATAEKSDDALKFSQAACNVANAICALERARIMKAEVQDG